MAERYAARRRRTDDDAAEDRREQAGDYEDDYDDREDDYADDREDDYADDREDDYADDREGGRDNRDRQRTQAGARVGRRTRDGHLSAARAAQAGLRQIVELTGKQPEGVTGVEPADDGWLVGVEVLEDRRIPSSADILAVYEAEIDADGDLASYRRVRRYARGRVDGSGGLSDDFWKCGVPRFGRRSVVRFAFRRAP
jgi:Gas vesicle synthesis protein GvpO